MSAVPGIDFERLELCDALDLAILIEEEALERYEELAQQLEIHRTPEAARFFRAMAQNEARHRAQLVARRAATFPAAPPQRVTRAMLVDVEAPSYDEARAFMGILAALGVALRAEEKARAFFDAALPRVADPQVRALFVELRDEEAEHRRMVLREIERLGTEWPGVSADDYVDEPVGQ